ncbi:MAG: hypothetical protein AB7G24_11425 [Novosphingobium sp.]
MGWGSAFSSAYATASSAAKSAVQSAAQTASTAWDYTRQKAGELYGAASNKAGVASQQAQQTVSSVAQWAGEKKDAAAAFAKDTAAKTGDAVGEAFDKIGDAFTGQAPGAPAATCPFAGTQTLPPPPARGNGQCQPPPPCFTQPLTVKCGHNKERAFLLIPPNTPTNQQHEQIIQVIADENDHDTMTIDFSAGACPKGCGANMPTLRFGDTETKSTLVVKVAGPPSPRLVAEGQVGPDIPFIEFAAHFLKRCNGAGFRSYSGTVLCGSGQDQSFEVQAFPKREWSGEIAASVGIERNKGKGEDNGGLLYSKSKTELSISGELSGTYGVRKITVKPPSLTIGRPVTGTKAAFKGTKSFLDVVYPSIAFFKESRYVKLEPVWPNLKLSGGMQAAEVKGRYNVDWKGEVSLSLSPLFGLSGRFDALQWLIDVACYAYLQPPPFAKLVSDQIKYLREKAEEGQGGKDFGAKVVARIDIEAKGSVSGTLKWEFLPEEKDKASGSGSGDLDISVKGELSGELRAWKVSYKAGATIVGESGFAGKIDACFRGDDPAWDGYWEFKGLKIKGMAYQSVGGSSVGSGKEGTAPVSDRKKKKKSWWNPFSASNDARAEDSASWEMVVIKPSTWGKEGEDDEAGDDFAGKGGSYGGGGSTSLASGSW